jgi:hypothetical protein
MTEPLPAPAPRPDTRPVDSARGCLLVLFSTIGGYGILAILALVMLRQPAWQLSLLDAAYLAVTVGMLLAQNACRKQGYESAGPSGSARPGLGLAAHLAVAALLWAPARAFHLA